MHQDRQRKIRELFHEYIEMYAARDDRLTERFSQNFSGYTGSGKVLIHDRDEWIKIKLQSYPLPMCLRPKVLMKGKKGS